MSPLPWLACLAAWTATASPAPVVAPAAHAEAAAGVWKGLARGDGTLVPPTGVPASLWLETDAEGALHGRMSVQGFDARDVRGTFDPATNVVVLNGMVQGMPFAIEATVADERMAGTVSAMGVEVALEVRRIAENVLAEPPPRDSVADVATLDAAAWREDLRFLADYLPQVHANAYHDLGAEGWRAAVAELDGRLDELDAQETAVALACLVARVGDAHTGLNWRELPGFDALPVLPVLFADGVFVISVDARWEPALGARVVEVGDVSVDEALARVAEVFAAENDSWRRAQAPGLLAFPRLLAALGLVESGERLPLVVELSAGERLELVLDAEGSGEVRTAPDLSDPPLWLRRRNEAYWLELLADERAVYVAYNRCVEDPARPMGSFVASVLEAVESSGAERLLIDLRHNTGGNSEVLRPHIATLAAHPALSGRGRLIGLIGRRTYSSGMLNAHHLRQAHATLVGEPTGGKPNSYGEVRSFRLPRSGLQVTYSTKLFRMLEDDPPAIEPDLLVEVRAGDWLAAADPVLESALALVPGPAPAEAASGEGR